MKTSFYAAMAVCLICLLAGCSETVSTNFHDDDGSISTIAEPIDDDAQGKWKIDHYDEAGVLDVVIDAQGAQNPTDAMLIELWYQEDDEDYELLVAFHIRDESLADSLNKVCVYGVMGFIDSDPDDPKGRQITMERIKEDDPSTPRNREDGYRNILQYCYMELRRQGIEIRYDVGKRVLYLGDQLALDPSGVKVVFRIMPGDVVTT